MARRERIEFTGHDGDRLAGSFEVPDGRVRATALFAHCFTCGKDIVAASRVARALVARGYAVLRFDFTGLGGSDGDFANTNFSSNVQDLVAAANHLRERDRGPSLLVGHSLGGTAVLNAAGQLPEVRAVATIGAPADASHVARQFGASVERIESEGEAEVLLAGRPFTIRKQFLDDIASTSTETLPRLGAALLVMHSPIDETVSIDEAARLYKAARHPKSFVGLDGSDHLLTRPSDAAYVAELVAAWASRYIDEERAAPSSSSRTSAAGRERAGGDAAAGADARPVGATGSGGAGGAASTSAGTGGTAAGGRGADGEAAPGGAISTGADAAAKAGDRRAELPAGEVRVVERDGRFLQDVRSDSHAWLADEPERVGGGDAGPDPYEHLLAALGSCTTMTLRMYARRKDIPLERVGVTLRHSREHLRDCEGCEERPERIEVIERDIELVGELDEKTRARLMAIADRCPVHRTLEGDLHVRTREV